MLNIILAIFLGILMLVLAIVAIQNKNIVVAIIAAGNTDNLNFKSSIGYTSSLGLYRMNYNEVLTASYNGSQVINLSWTSGCEFNIYQQMAIDDIEHLRNEEVICYCRSGQRSMQAAMLLESMGFSQVKNLVGGMLGWESLYGR